MHHEDLTVKVYLHPGISCENPKHSQCRSNSITLHIFYQGFSNMRQNGIEYNYSGTEKNWVFPANPRVQTKLLQIKLRDINGKISNTMAILLWTAMHREAITMQVYLYRGISRGKPKFAEFRITSIVTKCAIIYFKCPNFT